MDETTPINFTRGVPARESFPLEDIAAAARDALERHGPVLLQYGASAGFEPLREWLAGWQGVSPGEVLTANGSLQIIDFLCQRFLTPGDQVFVERPTYDRTLTLLRRHRARVVGIPLEPDGPDLQAAEALLKTRVPRFFYLVPDFQNPSGNTCSIAKRERLAFLADRYDFWLLEDAAYRPLRFRGDPLPSLFDLAPKRTLHLLSLSKLIGPGVRVGVLCGPPGLLSDVAKLAEDTYITPTLLAHGIAHEYCASGKLPGQIERLKSLYAPRLEACLRALEDHLPDAPATRPDGGFFVSLHLPEGTTAAGVRQGAQARALNLADGRAFFPDGDGARFLRLPYCALSPQEISEGIRRLGAVVRECQQLPRGAGGPGAGRPAAEDASGRAPQDGPARRPPAGQDRADPSSRSSG